MNDSGGLGQDYSHPPVIAHTPSMVQLFGKPLLNHGFWGVFDMRRMGLGPQAFNYTFPKKLSKVYGSKRLKPPTYSQMFMSIPDRGCKCNSAPNRSCFRRDIKHIKHPQILCSSFYLALAKTKGWSWPLVCHH